jgi:hypothetical protein
VSRARFIAAARLEFLAEVIYYSEAEAGLGARFAAAVEMPLPAHLPFLCQALRTVPILAGSSSRTSPSRLSTGRSLKELSSLRSHIMRGVPITGNLAYVPANHRIDTDRVAAGHAGR